ncbi:COX assembly mitochondrial protein 2 homolog [Amphiura filiformis]|uniref:COX assembly mitochondrial protein 2 homolog n=1 Tax=Amphiura filiformis TaxID=82378 RepID=UPI003B20EBE5
MHSDLAPHLHTPECNAIIQKYLQCQKDNPWKRFLGECGSLDTAMNKCLKKEREANRQENHRKSREMKQKLAARREERTEGQA